MKNKQQLINNIIGQLNGIGKMIAGDKDCFNVLIQMKATKSAINNLMNKYIDDNIINCLNSCKNGKPNEKIKKLIKELT